MDHRWRVISIQQKLMKLNNRINFITEDSTHEVPEASRGPSASKASNNIISFRENGCQSVFSRYCSVLPLHSMYRQPTAAADKMTDMPELHSGQIMWLNPRFLNHFSQDLSCMCHFCKCKQLFLIVCNPFFHTLYVFMILCMKHLEVAFHQSFLTGFKVHVF